MLAKFIMRYDLIQKKMLVNNYAHPINDIFLWSIKSVSSENSLIN